MVLQSLQDVSIMVTRSLAKKSQ